MSVEKTAEQIEQEQILYWNQHSTSSQFALRNPRFIRSNANAAKMVELLGEKHWTLENLEEVFQANQDAFQLRDAYKPPVEEQPPAEEILPEWGKLSTKAEVEAIPLEQYRKFIKNPDFVVTVNRILRKGAR
jgi:hypothetical protein